MVQDDNILITKYNKMPNIIQWLVVQHILSFGSKLRSAMLIQKEFKSKPNLEI